MFALVVVAARVDAGEHVDQRHTHTQWAAAGFTIGMAGDTHQATHGLDHQVVPGAFGVRAILPKAGDRAVDQARVNGLEALVI
jgi:hypothetical protein